MLALIAVICFVLAAFKVNFPIDLVPLGLAFFAAEFVWAWPWYRRTRP